LTWISLIFSLASALVGSYLFLRSDGWDYFTRWSETQYVRHGHDPIAAERAGLRIPEYGRLREGQGYPPWSYVYLEWTLGWLPFSSSKLLYWALNVGVCTILWSWAYRTGYAVRHVRSDALLLTGVALFTMQFYKVFWTGNYGLICAGCLLAIAWATQRNRNVLAGVFWALMLIKPQLGALVGIVFLVQKRWKTLLVAFLILFAAWECAAVQTGTPPIRMLRELAGPASQYVTGQNAVNGGILNLLLHYRVLPIRTTILLTAALCAIAASLLLWKFRNLTIEYQLLIPAVFSICWTYSQPHNWVVLCSLIVLLGKEALKHESRFAWPVFLMVLGAFFTPNLNYHQFYTECAAVWIIPLTRYSIWIGGLVFLLQALQRNQLPACVSYSTLRRDAAGQISTTCGHAPERADENLGRSEPKVPPAEN
jgi:hypothetical protein